MRCANKFDAVAIFVVAEGRSGQEKTGVQVQGAAGVAERSWEPEQAARVGVSQASGAGKAAPVSM